MLEGSKVIDYDKAMELGMQEILHGNKKMGFLVVCGINFGLRIGDLLQVTYDDLKNDSFVIGERKTGKKRKITVNSNVQKALGYMQDEVSYKRGGKCFEVSSQYVNRYLKKMFGEGFSSHGLRKGYGKRVYERTGKDIAVVQLTLQHSSVEHTLRYVGVTQEELDRVAQIMV